MAEPTVEERLKKLESQVTELMAGLKPLKPGKYDWINTVGMFGDDPVMKEICDEALKFREVDRERCRKKFEAEGQVSS
ncbi:MAG: hypothetical protein ACKV2Q_35630 [Planctomycetaceae bacterium]